MSKLNLDFAEESCVLPDSSKVTGTYCFRVEQRQCSLSQVPLKLCVKGFPFWVVVWQGSHCSDRILCWPHAKSLSQCPVKIEITSQEVFLAKVFSEPMLRQKNSEIHMANTKCLLFKEPDVSKQ